MNSNTSAFLTTMKNPIKFRQFLFFKLPSAFFSGVMLRGLDDKKCIVSVPYKWFSKNPFRSTYFACLAMAAEMSTGLLGFMQVYKRKPAVSMLVVKLEAQYYKKATGRTYFVCENGEQIQKAVEETIATKEPKTVLATSVGKNSNGELIAEFNILWSFKAK